MGSIMRIAFWGYGSIAKRHIKNLKEILDERGIQSQIDVFRHASGEIDDPAVRNFITAIYKQSDLGNKEYDVIFITCPTSLHYEAIQKCAAHAKHLFIEKPVFSDVNTDISNLNLKKDSVYYVACPLRYAAVLQYLKENVDIERVFSVRAISSSYLPDWRTGIDYRNTYSAQKSLGGGVAIDLIHEWDYLTMLFGIPEKIMYVGGKFSALEIDSDDIAAYIGIYKDKLIELHLDYFGRKTMRECVLYLPDETIKADIVNGKLEYLKSGKCIDLQEDRDAYQKRELEHFLDIIDGDCENDSNIQHAIKVLNIAKGRWE